MSRWASYRRAKASRLRSKYPQVLPIDKLTRSSKAQMALSRLRKYRPDYDAGRRQQDWDKIGTVIGGHSPAELK